MTSPPHPDHSIATATATSGRRESPAADLTLFWRATVDGEVTALSAGWQVYAGDRAGDQPAEQFWQAIVPTEQPTVRQSWQQAVASRQPFASPVTLRDARGQCQRFWLQAELVTGDREEWLGTGRREKSASMPADCYPEPEFLPALLDNLADGIVACDRHGQIAFCNATARQFLNLTAVPATIADCARACPLYPVDRDMPLSLAEMPLQRSLGGESLSSVELRILPATRSTRNLLVSGGPIRAESGACLGAVITLHDISRRKEAEAAVLRLNSQLTQQVTEGTTQLEVINRLYRSVLRSIGEVIFQTDIAGRWTFLSSPWTSITGYKIDECLGCSFLDWVFADEDRLVLAQQFQALIEGDRETVEHEFRSLTREGSFRWLEIYLQLETDPLGNVLGTSGAIEDISERRQTEAILKARADELVEQRQQIEHQNAELRKSSQLKSQFLATMSHELRTPMNAIMGFSQMLRLNQYGDLTARQIDMVERIFRNSQHLLDLLNEVLDFSKIEAGYLEIDLETFDLARLVALTIEELRSLAQAKKLALVTDIDLAIPQITSDRTCLRRILVNLVSNAIKFTETGCVEVTVWEPADGCVAIAVRDTGIGIAPENIATIFEAFRQVDQTLTRQHSGTGLGLAIVKSLSQLLQGQLYVESEPECGSEFRLDLPRQLSDAPLPLVLL